MTVAGIIEQYNSERPNQVLDSVKVGWLKKLESMIVKEVINTHEHDLTDNSKLELTVSGSTLFIKKSGSLSNHIDTFDMDTELLVPEPYDDVYIYYLDQRIALQNNDTKRYNVSSAQYNNAYLCYQQYFNRTYKTLPRKKRLFRHENI